MFVRSAACFAQNRVARSGMLRAGRASSMQPQNRTPQGLIATVSSLESSLQSQNTPAASRAGSSPPCSQPHTKKMAEQAGYHKDPQAGGEMKNGEHGLGGAGAVGCSRARAQLLGHCTKASSAAVLQSRRPRAPFHNRCTSPQLRQRHWAQATVSAQRRGERVWRKQRRLSRGLAQTGASFLGASLQCSLHLRS